MDTHSSRVAIFDSDPSGFFGSEIELRCGSHLYPCNSHTGLQYIHRASVRQDDRDIVPASDRTTGTPCQCQTGLQGHRASVRSDYRDTVPVSDRTTGTTCQCQTGLQGHRARGQGHRASVRQDYRDIVPASDRTTGTPCQCQIGLQGHRASVR